MRGTSVEFPSYAQYSTVQLLNAFTEGPARLRAAIAGLTESELNARARGEHRWSAHEIVMHTTDSELQAAYRIRKVWAEPGCDLPIYDQDAWVRALAYASQGLAERECALNTLAMLRRLTAPIFGSAKAEDWSRSARHPEYGSITLRNLLELYADHTERHIEQVLEHRKIIGRPLSMTMLLPVRLY